MSFKDKTFCASPGCKNECGRKMTDAEKEELDPIKEWMPVAYAYFCSDYGKATVYTLELYTEEEKKNIKESNE